MKKLLFTFYFLLFTFYSYGQVVFNNIYDTLGQSLLRNIVIQDTSYIAVGGAYSQTKITVVFFKKTGELYQIKEYGGDTLFWFHGMENSLRKTETSNYILGGNTAVNFYRDNLLIKFDANFDTIFAKKYYPVNDNGFKDVIIYNSCVDIDSSYLLVGQTNIDNNYDSLPQSSMQLIKTDTLGNLLWRKTYGNAVYYHWGYKVSTAFDGGYVIGGYTNRNGGDWAIVKTDENGENPIYRYYGHMTYDDGRIMGITPTQDSCYLVYGAISITDNTKRARIIKFDKNLNIEWDRNYHLETFSTEFVKIIEQQDSSLICLASRKTPYPEYYIASIFKLDKDGNVIFKESTVSGDTLKTESIPLDIKITNDNGYIFTGSAFNNFDWVIPQQMWLVKTDSMACDGTEWTCGVSYLEELASKNESGLRVYPNPAQNILNISMNHDSQDTHDYQDEKMYVSQINTSLIDVTDKKVLTKIEFDNLTIDQKLKYSSKNPNNKLWGKQEEQKMRELSRKLAYALPFSVIRGEVDIFSIEPIFRMSVSQKRKDKVDITDKKAISYKPTAISEIVIYDIQGRVVKQLGMSNEQCVINVADLQNGVYFVQVGNEVAKFVKE